MRVPVAALVFAVVSLDCLAQSYPAKPLKIVVPSGPGASTDVRARWLADKLPPFFGQSVVVENRAGGGGTIGTEAVVKSPPDGYTISLSHQGTLTINPHLYPKSGFDTLTDLVHITRITANPMMLAANPGIGTKSLGDFLKYARSNAGSVNFGTPGSGTPPHMVSELFLRASNLAGTHVPFKSGGAAVTELMAGRLSFIIESIAVLGPFARGGKVVPLAVTGNRRMSTWPDVPTIAEAGVPGFEYFSWMGVSAPANTPRDIVMKLNGDVRKAMSTPETREWLLGQGAEPGNDTPEEFLAYIRVEHARWGRVVREAGIKAD